MTIHEIEQLQGPVYQDATLLALRLTKNKDLAQDLVQEAYLNAFKCLDSFQTGSNLKNWMRTITYNLFVSNYRREKRRAKLIREKPPGENWMTNESTDNGGDHELNIQDLMRIINGVPPIHRDSFLLYYQGVPYKKIALRYGIAIGTAKSRVFTARKLLRAAIRAEYECHTQI